MNCTGCEPFGSIQRKSADVVVDESPRLRSGQRRSANDKQRRSGAELRNSFQQSFKNFSLNMRLLYRRNRRDQSVAGWSSLKSRSGGPTRRSQERLDLAYYLIDDL